VYYFTWACPTLENSTCLYSEAFSKIEDVSVPATERWAAMFFRPWQRYDVYNGVVNILINTFV
jgi:hypothetical protein